MSSAELVDGDLLEKPVAVFVNPWNRQLIPNWLLLPQDVSRAITRDAGLEPFRGLRRGGPMQLGEALATGAGLLGDRLQHLIRAASIDGWRHASERSVRASTRNPVRLAEQLEVHTLPMPLIDAGSGGMTPRSSQQLRKLDTAACVRVVRLEGLTHVKPTPVTREKGS